MRQLKLFMKDKQTYYDYVILEFLTDQKDVLDVQAGMFFMLSSGTLLKKPISIMDVDVRSGMLKFLVRRIGEGTSFLYDLMPGQEVEVVGPCGNAFPDPGGRPARRCRARHGAAEPSPGAATCQERPGAVFRRHSVARERSVGRT